MLHTLGKKQSQNELMSDLQVMSMSFLAKQLEDDQNKQELIAELHTKLQSSTLALAEVKHELHNERIDFQTKIDTMKENLLGEVESNRNKIGNIHGLSLLDQVVDGVFCVHSEWRSQSNSNTIGKHCI